MANIVNPCKVITGKNTRWSYANIWEPKAINGGTPKYSVSLIIPKSDKKTIADIEAAIETAIKEIGLVQIYLQTDIDVKAFDFYIKNGFVHLQDTVSLAKEV